MEEDPRILQLLERMIESGSSAEDVCAESPELLCDVQEQWKHCQQIDAHIDTLFTSTGNTKRVEAETDRQLPVIPGYAVLGVQGRGGMGIVYRARHLELNRIVALKMMLTGAYAGRVERRRFLREARAIATLRHANVVQVYDVGEHDGRLFFTMELFDGNTLAEMLDGNPQPSKTAAEMMIVLARAVEYAHLNGIIHRDLKPSNVLMTKSGNLKITDFGLAWRLEDNTGLTLSGLRLGTPSYMSPEQALGQQTLTPASDVYSLGAILYEMLTGRPPFRGESAADTEQQVIRDEPIAPSKLNAKVSRDLETICLSCLQKDPARRYSTALLLAEDLQRFERGEPINARPVGAFERLRKWTTRNQGIAAAVFCGSVLVISLGAGTGWYLSQRSAHLKIAAEQLRDAVDLQQHSSWPEANLAIERAAVHLDDNGPALLQRQLQQARSDSELAARLDAISLEQIGTVGGVMNYEVRSDASYRDAFHQWKIGDASESAELVAQRIRDSNVRDALIAAIYDWMRCTNMQTRAWLWNVASSADHGRSLWRDDVCQPEVWENGSSLLKMVSALNDETLVRQPVPFLMILGRQLKGRGQEQIEFLKRVQVAFPQDFWANIALGDAVKNKANRDGTSTIECLQYYRAAIAIRPDAALAYDDLGMELAYAHRYDEAAILFRKAIKLDPAAFQLKDNLAVVLSSAGSLAESTAIWEKRILESPNEAGVRLCFGLDLVRLGRFDEAIVQCKKAVELAPANGTIQMGLRSAMMGKGLDNQILEVWKHYIDCDPTQHSAWDGYGEFCLYRRNAGEYESVRAELLNRFGRSLDASVCERVGKTCLLLPGTDAQTQQATELIDRAISLENTKPVWVIPYYQFSKGLAEYRNGHFQAAIAIYKGKAGAAMGPAPRIITAMCHWRLGQQRDARETLADAIANYNWTPPATESHEFWMYQVLRNEAVAMIQPPEVAPQSK